MNLFDDFLCNKAELQNNKSQQLLYVPRDQFPHSCDICMPSQCKSCELEKYLNKKGNNYKKILFVCDGSNDFCPTQNILKQGDIVFPRAEHSLIKKLSKKIAQESKIGLIEAKEYKEIIHEKLYLEEK